MRYQISKQLDLWHAHDGILSMPTELARHLDTNRRNASIMVKAIAKDFEAAVDPITEVLSQDYDEDYLEDDECLEEPIPTPSIGTREDWAVPTYDRETWDTLTEVLDWIGVSEELKVNFTEKLLTECLPVIDPWIFGQAVKDAIELLEQQGNDFSEGDIITAATHLITRQIRESLESRGESLALYATIKLMVNESNQ